MILVVFSHPLRAGTSATLFQTENPFAQSAPATNTEKALPQSVPATKSTPAHHSTSLILAGIQTGFIGVVVPSAALLLCGSAIRLMITHQQLETKVEEEPLVRVPVPPLRPVPFRITKF